MSGKLAITFFAICAISGCGADKGTDKAKMVGRWEAEVTGMVQHLANSEDLAVGAVAIFSEDGRVEIRLEDGKSKGFEAKGAFELDGPKLRLNVVPFGGQSPQTVMLQKGGDSFTMESIAGQLTFERA